MLTVTGAKRRPIAVPPGPVADPLSDRVAAPGASAPTRRVGPGGVISTCAEPTPADVVGTAGAVCAGGLAGGVAGGVGSGGTTTGGGWTAGGVAAGAGCG